MDPTSSATLNSILTTTASPRTHHPISLPTVPAKRKIRDVSPTPAYEPYTALHPPLLSPSPFPYAPIPPAPASPGNRRHRRNSNTTSTHSATPLPEPPDVSSEAIDCICGFAIDDGFSIACDDCSRWCHSACFGIAQGGPVPEQFLCWVCRPRSSNERDSAVRLQRERLGGGLLGVSNVGLGELGLGLTLGDDGGKQRRRLSPGTDRRARKGHAAPALEGSGPTKRRRRPSVLHPPPTPTLPSSSTSIHHPPAPVIPPHPDDEHVDIDAEPWTATYVPITHDLVPDDDTRTKLRRHAQHWRGITAVSASPPPIAIRPLPPSPSPLLASTNPHCLPPAYAAYTTRPLPSAALITPFLSCITPSAAYLREPTNGYAHLGMPKPYVHLMGPPLGVALDARGVGGEGRFVRWGCRPNAVLRPVLCRDASAAAQKAGVRYEPRKRARDADETESDPEHDADADDTTLGFAVFALRDLKAGEEVVLGWEWDDGHAVHRLPAFLRAPHMFPRAPPPGTDTSPAELAHLRNQLSSILHALSSTFTTCACGARARDCALSAMAAVVARLDAAAAAAPFSPGAFPAHDPGAWRWAGHDDGRQAHGASRWRDVDLGPLIGRKRGFRTRERVPYSGGMGGMEMVDDDGESAEERQQRAEGEKNGRTSARSAGRKKNAMRVNGRRVLAGRYALEAGTGEEAEGGFRFSVVGPNGDTEGVSAGQDRNGKGKARAADVEDVEMSSISGRPTDPPPAAPAALHPASAVIPRSPPVPSTHTQPNLEPRPPDPPPAAPHDEERMPPKMRKRWMHREVKSRLQWELSQLQAAAAAAKEKETAIVTKDFDGRAVDPHRGLGIRFDDPAPPTPDDTLMPPPPMPAALDPTTISSQRARSPTPTPSPPSPSPHLPTPSPTHPFALAPRVVHDGADRAHLYRLHAEGGGGEAHSTGTSPLNGFASLSLMSPALMLGGEEKKGLLEATLTVRSPASPPDRVAVVEVHPPDEQDRQEGPPVDEDVEMGVVDDVHGGHGTETLDVKEQDKADAVPLAVPWSPLRRAEKAHLLPTVEIRVDGPDSEPDKEHEAGVTLEESHPAMGQHELSEEKSTSSPLDSMASTPPVHASPSPAPTVHVHDPSPPPHVAKQEEEPGVDDTVVMPYHVYSIGPEESFTSSEVQNPSPLSPSPRPSVEPDDTTDVVHNTQLPDSQLLNVAKALPPDQFFDTDDEEEWKRQMDVDEPPSTHASRSPVPPPVSDAQDDEDEDMEDTPRRSSISRKMRTPQPVSSESDSDADEPRERSPVPHKRRSSIDSSRSASVALDADTAAVDTEEPPPSTGTTAGAGEAPPPLSADSTSSAVNLATEERLSSPETTLSIVPDTSSTNPLAKSASPSPADSQASTAPDHQLSPAPPHDALAHDHAAQPKVKLSLRDFVLRKKKQREEQEATKSAQASPMSVTSALGPEDGDGERGSTPAPAARSVLKPLSTSDVKDGYREPTSITPSTARSVDLPTPSTAVSIPTPSTNPEMNGDNDNYSSLTANKQNTHVSPLSSKTAGWYSQINKHDAVELQASQEIHVTATCEKPWSNAAVTIADASMPDTKARDVVPIPSTPPNEVIAATPTKLDAHEPTINGYHRLPPKVPSPPPLPLPPKPPFLLPARPQHTSFSPSSLGVDTREAKKELLDLPFSHLSATRPSVLKPPSQFNVPSQTTIPHRLPVPLTRSISPISPDLSQGAHLRRPSHEDGEIEASPPLAPFRFLASNGRPFPPKGRPFTNTNFANPQSHSPPTGPRSSFLASSPTPTFGAGGSTYRPPANSLLASAATSVPISRPAPPSAPRALRQSMLSIKPTGALPSNGASSTSYGGSQYIPRGPSADRERDRDRDSRHYRAPRRGGGGGSGWPR